MIHPRCVYSIARNNVIVSRLNTTLFLKVKNLFKNKVVFRRNIITLFIVMFISTPFFYNAFCLIFFFAMAQQPLVGQGLVCTSDQPDAETST
jgi:hypothetical protein